MIQRSGHRCASLEMRYLFENLFPFLVTCLCVCVCARRRTDLDLTRSYTTSHVPLSSASLLPVCTASQVWKLADTWPSELIILDPGPITPHYPLCGPLSGERHVTIAQHESRRHHRALMDTPVHPRLLRSPGQETFKFSNSSHTKEALVQGHPPWPLEVKHRGEQNTKTLKTVIKTVINASVKRY